MDNAYIPYFRIFATFKMFYIYNIIDMLWAFDMENYQKGLKSRCRLDSH